MNFKSIYLRYIALIAVGIRTLLEVLFPSMYGDQWMQIDTFYNYISGNGLTMKVSYPNDISHFYYEKFNLWPFGFVLFNFPIYKLVSNISTSVLILNIISICVFFYALYRILLQLNPILSKGKISLIIFFSSISIMPFRYMGCTDLWCLSSLFLSIYYALDIIQNNGSANKIIFKTITIAILSCVMVTLRYTYWLLALACPFIILLFGIFKSKKLFKLGVVVVILSVVLSSIFIYLHYDYYRLIFPTSLPPKNSLQWHTLYYYNSLPLNTFFRDSILRDIFLKIFTGLNGVYIFHYLSWIVQFVFFIPLCYLFGKFIKQNFGWTIFQSSNSFYIFSIIALIIFFVNNLTIIYSSLKFGMIDVGESKTYPLGYSAVSEVRYFAPSLVIILIYIVISIQYIQSRIWQFLVYSIIIFGLCFSLIINIFILLNRVEIIQYNAAPKYLHYGQNEMNLYYKLADLKKSTNNLVFLPSPYAELKQVYMVHYANIPQIKDNNWSNFDLITKHPIVVLCFIKQTDSSLLKYKPQVIIHGHRPNIDLVQFKLTP